MITGDESVHDLRVRRIWCDNSELQQWLEDVAEGRMTITDFLLLTEYPSKDVFNYVVNGGATVNPDYDSKGNPVAGCFLLKLESHE